MKCPHCGYTWDALTKREEDVLRLLCEGKTNSEIAKGLGISIGTVKTHVSTLMGRLGAANRSQAIIIAIRQGLISLE